MSTIEVVRSGPLTTVQDRGRVGFAHLGVPRAGALDRPAADLANRLVGNDEQSALLEVTLGGLVARPDTGLWVAVTGADRPHARVQWVAAGETLEVPTPATGVRTYVAVAGGIALDPVLGSRSTDTLAWVGPARVVDGLVLPVGPRREPPRGLDTPRPARPGPLRVYPGPHADFFDDGALARLGATSYAVGPASNRVGLRLQGAPVARRGSLELPSEGMVLGAVQVPPDGQPVVLLADHPTTGGYPVVGVVHPDDLWQCAQVRPGEAVRFTAVRGA